MAYIPTVYSNGTPPNLSAANLNKSEDQLKVVSDKIDGIESGADVIEVGQNTNGTYVKFGDGTLMCWFVDPTLRTTSLSAAPVCYYSGSYTFSFSFVVAPTVVVLAQDNTNDLAWPAESAFITTTGCTIYAAGRSVYVQTRPGYMAVGRWK